MTPEAAEVIDSLTDELALPPWGGAVSIGATVMLIGRGVLRRQQPSTLAPHVLYVAHVPNGRLGRMAARSISVIEGALGDTAVSADRRLAARDFRVDADFPGLGIRSLLRHMDRGLLLAALVGAQRSWLASTPMNCSRFAATYLFAAQQVRYELAGRALAGKRPGLLVTDFDRSSYAAPLVHVARRSGWVTATTVHGSLNPTTYCPFRAEHVLVWGPAQADEAARHGAGVHIVGRPDLVARASDSMPIRRVVICDSGEDLSPDEAAALVRECRNAKAHGRMVQIRRHPRFGLLGERQGWTDIAELGESEVASRPLLDDLRPGDLVVGISSTALVEALFAGCRVKCLADGDRRLPVDVAEIRESSGRVSPADLQERIVAASGEDADRLLAEVIADISNGSDRDDHRP